MIDIQYCYLDDALGIKFSPEDYNSEQDKVGAQKYLDPDSKSKKLYEDLQKVWLEDRFQFKVHCTYNLIDKYENRYSSDFIGPSRYWAKRVGMRDDEIGSYLKQARTIGGHMIWPVHFVPTINSVRGGHGGFYDRIDLTLYEIQRFLLDEQTAYLMKGVRKQIEEEKWFFDILCENAKNSKEKFIRFIDFWRLKPFVDDNYQVLSLVNSDFEIKRYVPISSQEPIFPGNTRNITVTTNKILNNEQKAVLLPEFKRYVKNNVIAIKQRNALICKK